MVRYLVRCNLATLFSSCLEGKGTGVHTSPGGLAAVPLRRRYFASPVSTYLYRPSIRLGRQSGFEEKGRY